MAKIRTANIDDFDNERDASVHGIRSKRSGFGLGVAFGALLIGGALAAFAYNEGSFQNVGAQVDQMSAQVERHATGAVQTTQEAMRDGETATN